MFYSWTKWAHWSDEAFLNQFVKDIAGIDHLNELQWVFQKTEDITQESLHGYVSKALKTKINTGNLAGVKTDKLMLLTGIRDITETNKMFHFIQYFSKKSNFDKIFKVEK